MTDTDLEQRLRGLLPPATDHAVDTDRGWREFRELRCRTNRNRRRGMAVAAVAAAVAIATAFPALTAGLWPVQHATGPVAGSTQPASGAPHGPGLGRFFPGTYPRAVVARIGVTGVIDLAQDGTQLWAVREVPYQRPSFYQLVKINLRTDRVALRVDLGSAPGMVAASGGMVWLNSAQGQAAGQLVRLDPVTGKVITRAHLPAGRCGQLTFSARQLWAECSSGRSSSVFLRLDPVTGQVLEQLGPVRGAVGQVAIAPHSVWYYTNFTGISGLIGTGARARVVTVRDPAYPVSFAYTQSLVYSEGFVWALTNDESVARIDPATGRVTATYTYKDYDLAYTGGLDFLAVGDGSLWFLDDGPTADGVLRVRLLGVKPLGWVTIPPGVCGEPCSQIYGTPSAVWIPTRTSIIQIDPARLPS